MSNKQNSDLSKFKNLADYIINAYDDDLSNAERKDLALTSINEKLGINYTRTSIDNWIAGRQAIPINIYYIWLDELLETEVQFINDELGKELRRIVKREIKVG